MATTREQELELKLREVQLELRKRELKEQLPHLYGYPWYPWAWEFFNTTNKNAFLCAANQISKSSTQIRKFIDWATDTAKWPERFSGRPDKRPKVFWYLYPSKDVVLQEVETKWIPEFLPKNQQDPKYGWELRYMNKYPYYIQFKSGVRLMFKTYGQDVHLLQSGTVDMIGFDEELPEELYPELTLRREAVDGYFSGVFTATRGQDFWRRTIEPNPGEEENFVGAWKRQVSMYDCMFYMDGKQSMWTHEKIQRVINSLGTEAEIQRRVFGKFVKDSGLKFPEFLRGRNMRAAGAVPKDWFIYAGIDAGSGGEKGHPPAIVFVATNPLHTCGRVIKGWIHRGKNNTTATDIIEQFLVMRAELGMELTAAYYDWQAKDLEVIATRQGVTILPAEKSHEIGVPRLNALFKNEILTLDLIEELEPLATELSNLQVDTAKTKAKDDFADALRYATSNIPWNWALAVKTEAIQRLLPAEVRQREKTETDRRREFALGIEPRETNDFEENFNEWVDLLEA